MMEGITVLNSYPNELTALGIYLYVAILVGFLLSVFVLYCGIKDKYKYSPGIVVGVLFIVTFLVLFGVTTHKCFIKEPDTYYQVTLDEDVPYLEFTERYEIIEQEGKIYTIKEK